MDVLATRRVASRGLVRSDLARLSHHLTVEARNRPAITALRLLAVLNVGFKNVGARHAVPKGAERARLVLTGLSRTSSRHVVRKTG